MKRIFVLFLLVAAPAVHAEIYKFVDENGLVTYTNMPRPGSKPQLVIPDPHTLSKPGPVAAPAKSSGRIATPSYFPKVDVDTQRKRDDMRRVLLMEELHSEERNLAAARSALSTGSRQSGTDIGKLADSVRMHEKNIEMLNKELSHIR
jgi:hypothetical protein